MLSAFNTATNFTLGNCVCTNLDWISFLVSIFHISNIIIFQTTGRLRGHQTRGPVHVNDNEQALG